MTKFDALIRRMAATGMSPREIFDALKRMGTPVPLERIIAVIDQNNAQPKNEPPKTEAPPKEEETKPEPEPEPGGDLHNVFTEKRDEPRSRLGQVAKRHVKRAGRAARFLDRQWGGGYKNRHARGLAAPFEKNFGRIGHHIGKKIRQRGGQRSLGHFNRRGGVNSRAISLVGSAVVSSIQKLGETISSLLSKVDYGVRNSTREILQRIDSIRDVFRDEDREKREEKTEAENKSEAGMEKIESTQTKSSVSDALKVGGGLLAGGALGAGLFSHPGANTAKEEEKKKKKEFLDKTEFKADEIIFDAGKIVFTKPVAVGGAMTDVTSPDSSYVETPGPGGRGEKDVPSTLFQNSPMFKGPAPDESSPGNFKPGDLGNFKETTSKRVSDDNSGVGTGSMLKNKKGKVITTADTNLSPIQRTVLDVIRNGEGGVYNAINYAHGGGTFSSYDHHPFTGQKGFTSAGAYQDLATTWDKVIVPGYNKEHPNDPIRDFSPESQDKGNLWYAEKIYKKKTGRSLVQDLKDHPNEASEIFKVLGPTWISLDGSHRKLSEVQKNFEESYKRNVSLAKPNKNLISPTRLGEDKVKSAMKDVEPTSVPISAPPINQMSIDQEVQAAKHDVPPPPPPAPEVKTTPKQDRLGVRNEEIPETSFDDHYQSFPGLGNSVKHPGLGT